MSRPGTGFATVPAGAPNDRNPHPHRTDAARRDAAGVGERDGPRRSAIAALKSVTGDTAAAIAAVTPKAVGGNARCVSPIGGNRRAVRDGDVAGVTAVRAFDVRAIAHAFRAVAADGTRQHADFAIAMGGHGAVRRRHGDIARIPAPSGEHIAALPVVDSQSPLTAQRFGPNGRAPTSAARTGSDGGPATHDHAGIPGVSPDPAVHAGPPGNRAGLSVPADRLRRQPEAHSAYRAAIERQACEIAVPAVAVAFAAIAPQTAVSPLGEDGGAKTVANDGALREHEIDDASKAAAAAPVIAATDIVAVTAVAAAHVDGDAGRPMRRENVQARERALDVDLTGCAVETVGVVTAAACGAAIVEKQRTGRLRNGRPGEHESCHAAYGLEATWRRPCGKPFSHAAPQSESVCPTPGFARRVTSMSCAFWRSLRSANPFVRNVAFDV